MKKLSPNFDICINKSICASLYLFILAFSFIGCSIIPPPSVDDQSAGTLIIEARQSINIAREDKADEKASQELANSENMLKEAEKMLKKGRIEEASEFAYLADNEAKIAKALARESSAIYRSEKLKENIEQLIWESMTNEIAAARAKQSIAEKVAYEAQIGSEISSDQAERKIQKSEIELAIAKVELDLKLADEMDASDYAEQLYNDAISGLKEARSALDSEDFQKATDTVDRAAKSAASAFLQAKSRLEKDNEDKANKKERAVAALAKAEVSIEDARSSQADKYATALHEQSEKELQEARKALDKENYEQARTIAEQARVSASSAMAVAQSKRKDEKTGEETEEIKANALDAVAKAERNIGEASKAGSAELAKDLYTKSQASLEKARQFILDKDFENALSNAQDSIFNSTLAIAMVEIKSEPNRKAEEIEQAITQEASMIPNSIIRKKEKGVAISIDSDLFAKSGSDVRNDVKPNLKLIAEIIKKFSDCFIIIECHTDNKGSEKSKVQTSTMVASNLLNYLVNSEGIQRERLACAGYGSLKPVAANSDEAGRKQNRRIEIVFLTR